MFLPKTDVAKVVELAEENHWSVRTLGRYGMPPETVFKNGWSYEPMVDCTMPPVAVKRAQEVLKSGVKVQGFVIGHQRPREVDKRVIYGLVGICAVVVFWNLVLALLQVAFILVAVYIALAVDPALIVVLEDGTWVELARWY